MLGELTFDTGMPATATVVCSEPTTCLIFEGHKLIPLLKRNQEINSALLASHFSSSRRKLINSISRHLAFRQMPVAEKLVGA